MQLIRTSYLVLLVVLISVGVTSAYAINITLDGTVEVTDILNMVGNKITNLGTPTSSNDAATKGYVDTVASLPNQYVKESSTVVQPGNSLGKGISCDFGDTRISGGVSTGNAMTVTDSFPTTEEEVEVWEVHAINTSQSAETLTIYIICFDDAAPPHVP